MQLQGKNHRGLQSDFPITTRPVCPFACMILVWWEGGVRAGPKECSVCLLQHGLAECGLQYMVSILNGPPSRQAAQEVTARDLSVADCHNLQSSYGSPHRE